MMTLNILLKFEDDQTIFAACSARQTDRQTDRQTNSCETSQNSLFR